MAHRVVSPAAGAEGFTLLELLIALVILGFTLLSAQAMITSRLVRDVGRYDERAVASQLAVDRLQEVQADPQYGSLGGRYAGREDSIPGFPGFTRETMVRTGVGATTVTVRVVSPVAGDTTSRTIVVGAP